MDAEAQAQWAAWVGRSEGPGVWSSNQGARPCLLGLCSAAVVWGEVPAPPVPLRMHRLGRQRGRSTRMKTWEGAGTPGRETGRGSPPGPAPPVSASPAAETVTCRQHPVASPGSGASAREAGRLPGKRGAFPGSGAPARGSGPLLCPLLGHRSIMLGHLEQMPYRHCLRSPIVGLGDTGSQSCQDPPPPAPLHGQLRPLAGPGVVPAFQME